MGKMFPLQIFKDSDTAFERNIWRRDPREFSAPDYLDLQDNRQDFLDRGLALVATCFQLIGGLMSGVTIRVLGMTLRLAVTTFIDRDVSPDFNGIMSPGVTVFD